MDAHGSPLHGPDALAHGRAAPKLPRAAEMAKMRKVAEDFEAFFLGQMLQPMFAGIEAEKPFGGGTAEKMWRSLQVDEFGKAFARSGGIGIANAIVKEMLRQQEIK
jgi:Rod binding domain-containing protein